MNNLKETYSLNPADLFKDRTGQWLASKVPADVLDSAKSKINDMWTDGPGGWAYEFSSLASRATSENNHLLASLLYGIAKYPTPINAVKRQAFNNQLASYLLASKSFPFKFERKVALIPYRGHYHARGVYMFSMQKIHKHHPFFL